MGVKFITVERHPGKRRHELHGLREEDFTGENAGNGEEKEVREGTPISCCRGEGRPSSWIFESPYEIAFSPRLRLRVVFTETKSKRKRKTRN
jgi:hypothetical protein